jgi:catechol 1,2-dioxygenase
MTHADIEALVKQFLVDTATQGTPDAACSRSWCG